MVELSKAIFFPDHTQLLVPLILANCSIVFNNALGHKFLYRLIQSIQGFRISLTGSFQRSWFGICVTQDSSSPLALSLFISTEIRTTTNFLAAFITNKSRGLFPIAFHHNLYALELLQTSLQLKLVPWSLEIELELAVLWLAFPCEQNI